MKVGNTKLKYNSLVLLHDITKNITFLKICFLHFFILSQQNKTKIHKLSQVISYHQ